MAPSPVDKQPAGYKLPQDWLVSLAMDLTALCGENDTSGCHLAVFSEDVAFARHFVATNLTPTLPSCRSASGIDYPSKKLSKMTGYSVSYPFNS